MSTANTVTSVRSRTRFAGLVLSALCVTALASALLASAAVADVQWKLDVQQGPTNMVPGQRAAIVMMPENVGDTASSGMPTITMELPSGLSLAEATPFLWSCTGTTTVTCAGPSFFSAPGSAIAGSGSVFTAIVNVDPGAASGILDLPLTLEGGGAVGATVQTATVRIGASIDGFGVSPGSFAAGAFNQDGTAYAQAGGHPYEARTSFHLNTGFNDPAIDPEGLGFPIWFNNIAKPVKRLRYLVVDAPAGFVGDPTTVPTCSDMGVVQDHNCPPESQVGVTTFGQWAQAGKRMAGIYNMEPDAGVPAQFAFDSPLGTVTMKPVVRSDGDWGLSLQVRETGEASELLDASAMLWGVPADPSHDLQRCALPNEFVRKCNGFDSNGNVLPPNQGEPHSSSAPLKPFLTNPTHCAGPELALIHVLGWDSAGPVPVEADGDPDLSSPRWSTAGAEAPPLTGCDALEFQPTLLARPTTNLADSPSGLEVDLQIPQNEDPEGLAEANLKKAVVTLPEGLVVNPSGANGLGACSPGQIGMTSAVGNPDASFTREADDCPDAAKVGTVQVDSPALRDPVPGAVYVATPHDNPFGSLLALYISLDDPKTGIVGKIAGEVRPDPQTGQLTATFDQNPQLPFEHFRLNFFGGAAASLKTPATCGTYSTTSQLTPWSAPQSGPPATPSDTYAISRAPGGGACAGSPAALPNAPAFEAGATSPLAGNYSPFVLNLRREDGSQQFGALTVTPPRGLVAKLAGTPACSEAALAVAASKPGKAEQASPSCPAASALGSVIAGAGAGPAPYYAPGVAYLAGPYKGAPLSLAIVTPAVAGPFDLGTIVVRTALQLDSKTAQITAVSDPIPTILKGIPLDVRSISVRIDKPQFTLNPTTCDPSAVSGSLISTTGAAAALNNRFQLAECGRLPFKPQLKLSLKGGTKRSRFPALTAVLTPRPGDANISSVSVAFPPSEFLAQSHIRTVCTRVQFAADQCPAASVYGTATVTTPLLDYPLTGPVYLRSSSNELPDLVPDLRGPALQPIKLEAAGRTDSVNGGIRNSFDYVPDAPFTKLVLKMQGGKKGLLENSRDICAEPYRATVKYGAHNGQSFEAKPKLVAQCGKARKGKKSKGRSGAKGDGKR